MPKVGIVMGSINDYEVVIDAVKILKKFSVEAEVRVISAHRTPKEAHDFAANAIGNGIEVIIACAGKAAHLAGVMAAYTPLPVIGLPIKSSTLDGLDSLLSTVQMPPGVPVACVAVNGAKNAGLLAIQMLSIKYPQLQEAFSAYKADMSAAINKDDEKLQQML